MQPTNTVVSELVHVPAGFSSEASADARFCPDASKPAPLLIILHGFKAFARWGFFPYFGEYFAKQGFLTLTVNFSLNGVPHRINPDVQECTEPERFAHNTISQEFRDAEAMIEAALSRELGLGTRTPAKAASASVWNKALCELWNGEILVLAHSRGCASGYALGERFEAVRKIAAIGSVARLDRFTERAKTEWRNNGFFPVQNARTGQELRMNTTYLDDITHHAEQFEPLKTVQRLQQPLLLVHGEQDMTISLREGYELFQTAEKAGCNVRWERIPNTAHTFGVTHPMTAEQASMLPFQQVCTCVENFFHA